MKETELINVAVLTHNETGRADSLRRTLTQFFKNTHVSFLEQKLNVYILINGHSSEIDDVIDNIDSNWGDIADFTIIENVENQGCSMGVNMLFAETCDSEYTLFLEGDWYLPNDIVSKNWLQDALQFMNKNKNKFFMYLRKFVSTLEIRQFYGFEMFEKCDVITEGDTNFRMLKNGLNYTNNPHIRRNSSMHHILPLNEIPNETKQNTENWGKPEEEASCIDMKDGMVYLDYGCFVNIDEIEFDENDNISPDTKLCNDCVKDCNLKCKAKFLMPYKESKFCETVCNEHGSIHDIPTENDKYQNNEK